MTRMSTRTLAITIALLCLAPGADAEQVQFGWQTLLEYDSEITSGGDGDFFVRSGPVTRLEGEHQRLSYDIEHSSGYEKYATYTRLDAWRHDVIASAQYWISPRVRLNLSNTFQLLPQLRNDTVDIADTGGVPDTLDDRLNTGEVLTNVFTTTMTTAPHPRLSTSSQVSVIYRQFDDPNLNSQDTTSTTVMNQVTYQLNESHSFGTGLRFSNRDFQTFVASERTDATTRTYEPFASWTWLVDSRSTFSARTGPAWNDTTINDQQEPSTFPLYPTVVGIVGGLGGPLGGKVRDPSQCPAENAVPEQMGVIVTAECGLYNQDPGTGFPDGAITGPELTALLGLRAMPTLASRDNAASNQANLYFAFTVDRRWDRYDLFATWIRSDSQTQSLGSSTVVDTLQLRARYFFTERFRFTGTFRFTRRFSDVKTESLFLVMSDTLSPIPEASLPGFDPVLGAPVVGTTAVDTSFKQTQDSYSLRLQLNRDLWRHSSAFLGVSLRRQENDFDSKLDALDINTTTHSYVIQLGFTYRFQPMRF